MDNVQVSFELISFINLLYIYSLLHHLQVEA